MKESFSERLYIFSMIKRRSLVLKCMYQKLNVSSFVVFRSLLQEHDSIKKRKR